MNTAQTGLNMGSSMLATSAHNTANMNTEGHRDLKVGGEEHSEGVVVKIRQTSKEGYAPVDNAINLMTARMVYQANMQVVKAADEMQGELTDLFG